jgi:two-component system nitrogen regulation sensor histidine kinase NtrY
MGGAGGMHVRLVFIFSLIAAVPTLLVVVFASWLFQSGVEFWFSDSSRGLLENANKLARGYYEQAQRDVGYESVAMAEDLRNFLSQQPITSPDFAEFYSYQVVNRKLTESAILQSGRDGKLRTAAIVDPEGNSSSARIGPDVLKRLMAATNCWSSMPMPTGSRRSSRSTCALASTFTPREVRTFSLSARASARRISSRHTRCSPAARACCSCVSTSRCSSSRWHWSVFRCGSRCVLPTGRCNPLYQLVDAARGVGAGNFSLRIEGRRGRTRSACSTAPSTA